MPIQLTVNGISLTGHQTGTHLRVIVEGELDVAAVPDLEVALEALVRPGMSVALDLDGLAFVDSAGMRVLALAAEAAEREGWTLTLAGAQAHLQAIASLCGLEQLLALPAS